MSFIFYSVFLTRTLSDFVHSYSTLQESLGGLEEVLALWKIEQEVHIHSSAKKINILQGNIDFQHIDFQYPTRPNTPIFQDFSLTIQSKDNIAIIGNNGIGKSTISKLLLGYYPVQKGTILLDKKDIQLYDKQLLRKQIGIVPQEVVLLDGTIKKNILLDNTCEKHFFRIVDQLNILPFVEKFPQKWDTRVGENGWQLSGGQRQRIAIARVMIKNPSIVILDEALQSLDDSIDFLATFKEFIQNKTTLIITHQKEFANTAQRIYTLDNGTVKRRVEEHTIP